MTVIKPTSSGSSRLDPCEVCGKQCDSVYHKIVYKEYIRHGGKIGYAHVSDTFGHRGCLEGKQHD